MKSRTAFRRRRQHSSRAFVGAAIYCINNGKQDKTGEGRNVLTMTPVPTDSLLHRRRAGLSSTSIIGYQTSLPRHPHVQVLPDVVQSFLPSFLLRGRGSNASTNQDRTKRRAIRTVFFGFLRMVHDRSHSRRR